MARQISAIDLHFLVKELKDALIGAKIDSIYNPEQKELILQVHVPNAGKKILRILPTMMYLTDHKEKYEEPSGFCQFLRKSIANARVKDITQLGSEMIILFLLEKKEGFFKLVTEFFNKGNVLLLDDKDIVLAATDYPRQKDRTIRPKAPYTYPKREFNVFEIKKNELKKIVKESNKDKLVTCIATELGIGGLYSEEICVGLEKNKLPKELDDEEISKIYRNLANLFGKSLTPKIFLDSQQKLVDFAPVTLRVYEHTDYEVLSFKDYCSLLEELQVRGLLEEKKPSKAKAEKEKLEKRIEAQQKAISSLEKEEISLKEKAELIYNNYQLVNDILKQVNDAVKKIGFAEVEKKLKGHKTIKAVDGKEKTVTVNV